MSSGGPDSSVGIATDYGLDGPGSNSGGDEIFRKSRPALCPPSLLYNGYQLFIWGNGGLSVGLTPSPHLMLKVLEKGRAITLLNLRACVAYKKGENLSILCLLNTTGYPYMKLLRYVTLYKFLFVFLFFNRFYKHNP